MAGIQVFSSQSGGGVAGNHFSPSTLRAFSSPLPLNPDPLMTCADSWKAAEQTAEEIVCMVQPTLVSDQRRKEVIEYVQKLLRCCLGCEVFPYGSVPLMTYLPDGDIDLTALSCANIEDALSCDVLAVIKAQEQNEAAEFNVKDVQYISAEVKLVKCLVENIIVDISFNQLGGLSTLCFLEQVDRVIGKDHLLKRSIILIKAWCYYESRILGAHHGLISTYALETLVLYIFQLFHSSLTGPLAVLYKFLDYFSKFDWENYCISLRGPVCRSSLPDIVAKLPENCELLLTDEFLQNSLEMFSVPSRGIEPNTRAFPVKHLNIIDPLKANNNLGRSVNRGNFFRIRSAFTLGARKLGRILQLPREGIAIEIRRFFPNTLERHRGKSRIDLKNIVLHDDTKGSNSPSSSSVYTLSYSEDIMLSELPTFIINELERDSSKVVFPTQSGSETDCTIDVAEDLVTSKLPDLRITTDMPNYSPPQSVFEKSSYGHDLQFSATAEGSVSVCSPRESLESMKLLSELSGDYEGHIRSLVYGLCCQGYAVSPKDETVRRSLQFNQSLYYQMNTNSVVLGGPPFYPVTHPTLSGPSFHSEGRHERRGTGTYFPNISRENWNERPWIGRGRNQAAHSERLTQNNSRLAVDQPQAKLAEEDLSQLENPPLGTGKSSTSVNIYPHSSWGKVSQEHQVITLTDSGSSTSCNEDSTPRSPLPAPPQRQRPIPPNTNGAERITKQSYHLRDDDFPPLSL